MAVTFAVGDRIRQRRPATEAMFPARTGVITKVYTGMPSAVKLGPALYNVRWDDNGYEGIGYMGIGWERVGTTPETRDLG